MSKWVHCATQKEGVKIRKKARFLRKCFMLSSNLFWKSKTIFKMKQSDVMSCNDTACGFLFWYYYDFHFLYFRVCFYFLSVYVCGSSRKMYACLSAVPQCPWVQTREPHLSLGHVGAAYGLRKDRSWSNYLHFLTLRLNLSVGLKITTFIYTRKP